MARLRMTKQEQEEAAVEKAREAQSSMSDEERKEEIAKTAKSVANDVAEKTDKRPKPKKASKAKPGPTPAQEAASHNKREERHDPLQGVTIDPDANYPKILNMVISVGADDERSMEEFIEDVKDAVTDQANAKLATVLLSKVMIEGKHISSHHYETELKRLRPQEEDASE